MAEEKLLSRVEFSVTNCQLAGDTQNGADPQGLGIMPGLVPQASASTRSTFLMVFSPDKDLIASTHGDHNIYVSKVRLLHLSFKFNLICVFIIYRFALVSV